MEGLRETLCQQPFFATVVYCAKIGRGALLLPPSLCCAKLVEVILVLRTN